MTTRGRILPLAAVLLAGCVRLTPETPAPRLVRSASAVRAGGAGTAPAPLVIEVALIPEPGEPSCPEAPAGHGAYFDEVRDCMRIGAAAVRVQPIAPSGAAYDRSLANYRDVVRGVLRAAPDAILDLDLAGAPDDAAAWARCNKRIELGTGRSPRDPFTPASGADPMEEMRRIISRGGHLRVGLRQSRAWPHKGRPTNLDYLRQAVSIAHSLRRPVATPAEARGILGLAPLAPLYAAPSAGRVRAGGRFSLDAIAGPLPAAVRGYAVVVDPSGRKYSITKRGRLAPGVAPFVREPEGIRVLFYKTLVDTVIDPRTRPGAYTIHLALVPLHSVARAETALAIATETVTVEEDGSP